jgi:hypothetical protein
MKVSFLITIEGKQLMVGIKKIIKKQREKERVLQFEIWVYVFEVTAMGMCSLSKKILAWERTQY